MSIHSGKNEIMVWLSDMKQAIQEINDFLPAERNFFAFQKDLKTKRAIVVQELPKLEKVIDELLKE